MTSAPALRTTATALDATMRHLVTGVTVLTCGTAAEAEGVTVSTLTTVPGDPPMVCVALRQGSRGLAALLAAGGFVANGLAADHEWLARHFARRRRPRGLAQLPAGAWDAHPGEPGPRLRGAVCWLTCRLERTVAAGNHEFLFAGVLAGGSHATAPLVNFAGVLHAGLDSPSPRVSTERKTHP
ncbi:flavin reductase family protein [Streptomyces sp. MMBL 11-3]|uniref:flavin reductase family protein n=1 Tax=Streptomyces sp. MMBL 11-3 TaxID=3382639 RepID=UPI0039B62CC7